MRKTKAQIFVELFYFWTGQLDITNDGVVIGAMKDNRLNCPACVDGWDIKRLILRYNSRKLGKEKQHSIIKIMFHEISHLIDNLPYITYKEKVISERKAEVFAIRKLKKYYKQEYDELVKELKQYKIVLEKLYYDAYKNIKIYRGNLKLK